MRAIILMFAIYSRIPMPRMEADEKSKRFCIAAFPLMGVVVGLAELFVYFLARRFAVPMAPLVCLLMAVPILLTGGIHLDGFIDTADARSSYLEKERKLEILKDPHVGAFGIIRLVLYVLLMFAGLWIALSRQPGPKTEGAMALIPVLGRCSSGLTGLCFPKAKKDGMLSELLGSQKPGQPAVLLALETVLAMLFFVIFEPFAAVGYLLVQGLFLLYYRRMTEKEFGGVTGDLLGYYLCMSELFGVWIFAIFTICKMAG